MIRRKQNMTNKKMVVEVLQNYGAMTSRQVAVQIFNKYGASITPAQVAGVLRPLIVKGEAANSKDERNQTRYWLVKREV
jgi:hypothetical protein